MVDALDSAQAPQPSISPAAGRGWHGMRARPSRFYRPEDWRTYDKLRAMAVLVDVVDHSPAWRAGIRNGAWLLLINGMTLETFEARGMPVGSMVVVKAFQPGFDDLDVTLTLVDQPKPKRAPRRASRSRVPPAECGKIIVRCERPKWETALDEAAYLSAPARVIGGYLCNRAIRDSGTTDEWPVKRIGACLGFGHRTVERALQELRRAGFLAIVSGRRARRNNRLSCTWPKSVRDETIVYLRPPGQRRNPP